MSAGWRLLVLQWPWVHCVDFTSKGQSVTTPEIKAGMAFYALPWIPSKPAQGMVSPPAARHALASALTEGVGFERSGGEPRKPSVNVRQSTTNEGSEMSS